MGNVSFNPNAAGTDFECDTPVEGVQSVAAKLKPLGLVATPGSVLFAGTAGVYSEDNANLFWNNTTKRLGIGTATPSAVLTVDSGAINTSRCVVNEGLDSLDTQYAGYEIRANGAFSVAILKNGASQDLSFWAGTLKRMTVNAVDGNVGIGTASPNAPLDVKGVSPGSVGGFPSGSLHVTSSAAGINDNAVITGHNSFGGNKQLWYLGSTSISNDNIALINRQNAILGLYTNSIERLRIEAGGDIGIGITPTAKLDVNGDAKLRGALDHDGTTVGFYSVAPVVRAAVPTAEDAALIDATYDAVEQGVLNNVRTRLGEVIVAIQGIGIMN